MFECYVFKSRATHNEYQRFSYYQFPNMFMIEIYVLHSLNFRKVTPVVVNFTTFMTWVYGFAQFLVRSIHNGFMQCAYILLSIWEKTG